MKTYYSIALVIILATGCSVKPAVVVPQMTLIPSAQITWTDVVVEGKEVHVLDKREWSTVRYELVNRRSTGNICIGILNNLSKK